MGGGTLNKEVFKRGDDLRKIMKYKVGSVPLGSQSNSLDKRRRREHSGPRGTSSTGLDRIAGPLVGGGLVYPTMRLLNRGRQG